ncbi:MAG: MipA/OmpV family protein [Sulfurimonadaceae bacterium]|jgi:outer membrane protein|nr:MipA/OmpV family protein [Sulfurimonadaceae bacterium]
MRYLGFILLLFNPLLAQTLTLGAGPYVQTQPYAGAKAVVVASPVIFFDNNIFYIRWSRAGVYFLGSKEEDYAWGLSLVAQPRPYGYESSDAAILEGMDRRKQALEAGIAFSIKVDKIYLEIMALTDVTNHTDAYNVKSELGYEFSLGDFIFYPSFLIIYQSSKFTNYYYGVKPTEATSQRKAYTPTHGVDFGVQTYIEYPLHENFLILVNLRADKLSKEITKSPLVNDSYIYSGLASVLYKFNY